MKKVYYERQLKELDLYPIEVIIYIKDIIQILNENYGKNRDLYNDLGGYIVIAESIKDINLLKDNKLKGLYPEYTDLIECKEGVQYTSTLFLLSSDYSIVVISEKKLSVFLLGEAGNYNE